MGDKTTYIRTKDTISRLANARDGDTPAVEIAGIHITYNYVAAINISKKLCHSFVLVCFASCGSKTETESASLPGCDRS